MKKDRFKFLACFFLFISLFFLPGCGGEGQAEKEKNNFKDRANSAGKEDAGHRQDGELEKIEDEETRRMIKDFQKELPSRVTSVDKINSLEKRGEISKKEALKL